eukprot:5892955-Prymnesium_polylepis.1
MPALSAADSQPDLLWKTVGALQCSDKSRVAAFEALDPRPWCHRARPGGPQGWPTTSDDSSRLA